MVRTQLEGVWRQDSDSKEPQEHKAANGRVLNMRVGCGQRGTGDGLSLLVGFTSTSRTREKQGFSLGLFRILTWEALAGQVPQRPEDVAHELWAAGAGLGDGGEDFLDVALQVLLHGHNTGSELNTSPTDRCIVDF